MKSREFLAVYSENQIAGRDLALESSSLLEPIEAVAREGFSGTASELLELLNKTAFIESFNSRLREECLNEQVFRSLDDARRKIEQWRNEYNRARPHSSLGYVAPEEFAAAHSHLRSESAARSAGPAKETPSGALHRATVAVEERDSVSAQPQIG